MEWQPIETAPKYGRPDIPRDPPLILLSDGGSIHIGFWNGHSWDDGDFHDDLGVMSHWMPLPEAPR